MTTETERCDNCRFSTPTTFKDVYNREVEAVFCRYNPPFEAFVASGFSRFPRLPITSWCGKWESVVTPEVVSETKEWTDQ